MPSSLASASLPLIEVPSTQPADQATQPAASQATVTPVPDTEPALPEPLAGNPIEQAQEVVATVFDAEVWGVLGLRILLVGVVVLATMLLLGVGRRLILNLQRARNLPDSIVQPIRRTLRWMILLLAFILALQLAGFSMATIWAAIGGIVALLGVAFIAVWSVLSNIACSLMLMIFKPFRIGDIVEILDNAAGPNIGGRVSDVTLMYVVLREETEEGPALIQVPNNLFFQKTIRRRAGRRSVPIEQHVEKHGLTGREQRPPPGA